jgi:hypothetical protein
VPALPLPDLHNVLFELLMIADDLACDDDHDYSPVLAVTEQHIADLKVAGKAPVAVLMFNWSLVCLNAAAHPARWRWLLVVAALRPMIEAMSDNVANQVLTAAQRARMS